MAHLLIRDANGGELLVPLEKKDLIIGRSRICQVQCPDPAISRQHVRIIAIPEGGYEIEAIPGSSGLWSQGRRIEQRQTLINGVPYSLGNSLLLYESKAAPLDKQAKWQLVALLLNTKPKQYNLTLGRHTVGRGQEHHLSIQDPSLSRYHAQIYIGEDKATITDQNSANGTYVNQKLCSEPVSIQLGDIVQFGTVSYKIIPYMQSNSFPKIKGSMLLAGGVAVLMLLTLMVWQWQAKTSPSKQPAKVNEQLASLDIPATIINPAEQSFWQKRASTYLQAQKLFEKQQFLEAQQQYLAVLQIDPLYQPAWQGRLETYRAIQRQHFLREYEHAKQIQQPLRALSILQHPVFQQTANTEYQQFRTSLAKQRYEQLLHLAKEFNHAQDWTDGYRYALQALRHVPNGLLAKALAQESYLQLPKQPGATWPMLPYLIPVQEIQIPKQWSKKATRPLLRYASGNYQESFNIVRTLLQQNQLSNEERVHWNNAMDWTQNIENLAQKQAWREIMPLEQQLEQLELSWFPAPLLNHCSGERKDKLYEKSNENAEQAFQRGSYAQAFAGWSLALSMRPNDRTAQARLVDIEHRANGLFTELTAKTTQMEAADCKTLLEIQQMSKEQSALHQAVTKRLQQSSSCGQHSNNNSNSKSKSNKKRKTRHR